MGWLHDLLDDWRWVLVAYVWGIGRTQRLLDEEGSWEDVPWWVADYAENILENREKVKIKAEEY